ncbi:hypothetical protein DFQ26_009579 [Actinomortierella ambigua]|nr:hypothetical protein DFQ26_009579 [Actinomortierella ambigua]
MASTSSLVIISIPPIVLLVAIVVILFLYYEPAREWLARTRHSGYALISEHSARIRILSRGTVPPYRALTDPFQEAADADEEPGQGGGGPEDGMDQDNEDPDVATGSTTSARLRMHHEMVQQMRMRAGFAPEPFPGDVPEGEDDEDDDNDDDDDNDEDQGNEDDGGVGSSNGAATVAAPLRIKKVGKKKAKSLQRKEQMRAYREFLEAQREERRQHEELLNVQQSIQQEERLRQRKAQQGRDQKLREQQKLKDAKVNKANQAKKEKEKEKEVQTRRGLRMFIHNVKSFNMADIVKRFSRSEALLINDLEAIAAEDAQASTSSPRIILRLPTALSASPALFGGSSPKQLDSFPDGSKLVLLDQGSGMYLVLDKSILYTFAHAVQENGKISKRDLSSKSGAILHPLPVSS